MTHFVRKLLCIMFAVLPLASNAALQDWYGVWSIVYSGSNASPTTCTLTVTPMGPTQASAAENCRTQTVSPGVSYTETGTVTASGITWSIFVSASGMSATCTEVDSGAVKGNSASGQWTVSCQSPQLQQSASSSGTWSMTRLSGLPPTAALPPPPAAQTAYTASTGKIPDAAVAVDTANSTYGKATLKVTLDIAKVLQGTFVSGFAAGGYNVYVVALVPGSLLESSTPVLFVKPKAPGNWSSITYPIASYLQNVDQNAVNNQVVIQIISDTDITSLLGTEIYIGYGTSDTDMLTSGRYRGVYKVQ
jgi:hypothetical protein